MSSAGTSGLVLVVGATGDLGGRVVKALLARGKRVRALVRPGSKADHLAALGVEVARGDLTVPESLAPALAGVDAVVTTAAGYTHRRKGDSLAAVDDQGNRNLVDAARRAGTGRFVFTSILTCDVARDVPHFWQKKLIEDYLESSGVPFVALRPGAYIGGAMDFWGKGLAKGKLMGLGRTDVRWTYVHIDDVARCLALAVDEPRALNRRIDIGMDRPFSTDEAAKAFAGLLGREIRVRALPWPLVGGVMGLIGLVKPWARDMKAMFEYFFTGKYAADTSVQAELFGPVPTVEDSLRRVLPKN